MADQVSGRSAAGEPVWELPMAVAGCALDPAGLGEQAERYRRLGAAATAIERAEDRLIVTFGQDVDSDLLAAAIATERRCCPFLVLNYDPARCRLSIGVSDPARRDALDVVLAALGEATPAGASASGAGRAGPAGPRAAATGP